MFKDVCIYMDIYEYVYTYIFIYTHICVYSCIHMYIYIQVQYVSSTSATRLDVVNLQEHIDHQLNTLI
jgi:hypothetical protein